MKLKTDPDRTLLQIDERIANHERNLAACPAASRPLFDHLIEAARGERRAMADSHPGHTAPAVAVSAEPQRGDDGARGEVQFEATETRLAFPFDRSAPRQRPNIG